MGGITDIWNLLLVWPIEGALRTLTEFFSTLGITAFIGPAGIAIILFTITVRTLMLPLSLQQARSQKAMARLQPQLKEIQKRYSGDRAKQSQEQMRLYRESGVNPAAGCLPLVVQMPIWFALYSALITLANNDESFKAGFLWIPSLAHGDPFYILPVLTGATQWVVQRMSTMPSTDPQQQQMNRMLEFMPIMFFVFSLQVASGLALYWVISNIYSFIQQYFIVGWGNLPYLGTRGKSPEGPGGTNGNGAAKTIPGGRTRGSSSSRRKKGK